jgi:hypothetical protein
VFKRGRYVRFGNPPPGPPARFLGGAYVVPAWVKLAGFTRLTWVVKPADAHHRHGRGAGSRCGNAGGERSSRPAIGRFAIPLRRRDQDHARIRRRPFMRLGTPEGAWLLSIGAGLLPSGLQFGSRVSVTSEAEGMVPTGGELMLD